MQTHYYTGGKNNLIVDLLADGSHRLEAWGNKSEGFTPYLVSTNEYGTSGVPIGQTYKKLFALRADALKVYRAVSIPLARSW